MRVRLGHIYLTDNNTTYTYMREHTYNKHVLYGLAYAASPKPALFLCDWAWPKLTYNGVSFLSIN